VVRGRLVVLVGLVMLVGPGLAGCSGRSSSASPSEAQRLWSSRTAYVGDSSRVADLVREIGPAPAGGYTLSLQTEKQPYSLEVAIPRPAKPFRDTDFAPQATLLLGLVANLDRVSFSSGDRSYSLSVAEASTKLGYDVKELGRDQSRLDAYLHAQSD
jgi:hypothetical protein